jgi:hypothetical protein
LFKKNVFYDKIYISTFFFQIVFTCTTQYKFIDPLQKTSYPEVPLFTRKGHSTVIVGQHFLASLIKPLTGPWTVKTTPKVTQLNSNIRPAAAIPLLYIP